MKKTHSQDPQQPETSILLNLCDVQNMKGTDKRKELVADYIALRKSLLASVPAKGSGNIA